MKDKSLRELASIINPIDNIPQEETPLLIAVGAVGKASGINISFPTKSGNLTDIQTIADACGFRIRRVTLTGNWWNHNCDALLAFTKEEQPVAILPSKSNKSEILDPVNLTRKSINRNSVANLIPLAYTFYR
ncbi:MAG: NHLP bacteriocin export ABC transporter permease/ATPase subunit, partial [Cyanobacteria bacterium J06629_18]